MSDLEWLRAQLEEDPAAAIEASRPILDAARADGDHRTVSAVLAVVGRARLVLGELELAELTLLDALRAARSADDQQSDEPSAGGNLRADYLRADDLAADAHLALASVLSFRGRFDDARAELAEVERIGSPVLVAQAQLQHAAIAQRAGRPDEALERYARALPGLREAGRHVDVARVLANCGIVNVFRGEVVRGIDEIREARDLYVAHGQAFAAARMTHNLGWGLARLGALPDALAHFDEAQRQFDAVGYPGDEAVWDRAEVLLAAGLVTDARTLGTDAAQRMAAAGNLSGAAEAWLLAGQAARVDGDLDAAERAATEAERLWRELGNDAWAAVADLERCRVADERSPLPGTDADDLAAMSDTLAAAGIATAAVGAAALGAVVAGRAGAVDLAAALAASAEHRARAAGTLEATVLASTAKVAAALARGERTAAVRSVRRGIDAVLAQQAVLGAADARAQVAVHGLALAATGLRLALDDGSALGVLRATERLRATAMRHPPALPPDDGDLARGLADLRRVVAAIRAAESEGADTADLRHERRRVEVAVRNATLRRRGDSRRPGVEGAGAARPGTPARDIRGPLTLAAVRTALGPSAVLVSVTVSQGDAIAVVVDRRRTALAHLGPAAVIDAAGRDAVTALGWLARPRGGAAVRRARVEALTRALGVVGAAIEAVGTRPDGEGPIVLAAPPGWTGFPWLALPPWRGRPVVLVPSVNWWLTVGAAPAASPAGEGRALVVAGPRLMHADDEADAVAAVWPAATVLHGADATVEATLQGLATVDAAHLVAHGNFRHDNPLWSAIDLADGPLTVYDLERLHRTPGSVVLSSCESGAVGPRAGDELLGVAAAFLGRGTRRLVTSTGPLPDVPTTAETMTVVHRAMAAGGDVARVLAGLVAAELAALAVDPTAVPTAAGLAVFAAP